MTPALDPETVDERDPRTGSAAPGPAALADDALAEEIELYAEVVVAASESEGPLPEGELDRVLGVDEPGR
ncbi:hypothetical protein GTR02_14655 [Kineococcus sp. R8]|uniref:hypothetical protein n=1 Tax=Kineococcus siccus TaxID=2696567 RepID=UPI0014135151|nr:hypothetical protein [Kineococcus siccus]NAZ83057.1 hypothetical protein [Kineococcus siccus]